jgi:hypothetical protein
MTVVGFYKQILSSPSATLQVHQNDDSPWPSLPKQATYKQAT